MEQPVIDPPETDRKLIRMLAVLIKQPKILHKLQEAEIFASVYSVCDKNLIFRDV